VVGLADDAVARLYDAPAVPSTEPKEGDHFSSAAGILHAISAEMTMKAFEELFGMANQLEAAAETGNTEDIEQPLSALKDAAHQVERAFSGSWLGYHSRVYYEGFAPPPPGANFSQEWGLKDMDLTDLGSRGAWREYKYEDVEAHIEALAKHPNLDPARVAARNADEVFDKGKAEISSIFETELANKPDAFLSKLKAELEKLEPMSQFDIAEHWSPKGQIITRDMIALGQHNTVPAHINAAAKVASFRHSFGICKAAADIARKAASHLERKERKQMVAERVGTNVFIGHGRSPLWRELKDFVQDRLGLPWDEFNRVPVAGVTNIARLSEMLDAAAIAFLVMTAEDEMADGAVQARMNVVHEAGLFQGRLSFTKAIVLLEEGCEEFSNIQGLGQIHFPRGKISAAFEEVRRVLEREGLIAGPE
jgi:predicted nucleotide-binding protein